ncbi:hypothetical protein FHR83_007327 [Actinoplanes campanulatus]|uniref:Uncharacterized protein n=1 Tax=Actinoplanes campanulatus TaxID=113559 RepID=A0A7W5ANN7_9ACTN|nr:hypothetical protein [Actinoplanes campanulatus]MBB3099618.1 hypothetical protein [Actinoplanes campanulatus]GGN26183.1 hypothetical protein GCM10010109_42910 [Actinoplanes campanulatus]GID41510.1 hypothetical protein Aca09nite_80160 [Actinoplanes campanulatus]
MGRVTRRQLTDLPGTLSLLIALVLASILAVLAFGLPALDRAVPAERPVAAGEPYRVAAGVTIVPPDGASLDATGTRPGAERGTALFRLGRVQYAIGVEPFKGDLTAAAVRLRQRITGTSGNQVTGTHLTVSTAGGLAGVEGGYTAGDRDGRYAVFVADGLIIEVMVSGDDADLERALPRIDASTRTLRYETEK